MWILPKQLHTSPFVPGMEALISDSNEQSQACAQSLLARSKPSPARTWSQRWKRDSWTRHLSGRILKPSHGPSFVTAWISFRVDTLVSRSQPLESDSAPKTHDTSGRIYQPELLQCDQVSVSLKTSRDISRWGCPTSSKTWQDWVTERRGAYSARLKSARRTSASGSSSWPTATSQDGKQGGITPYQAKGGNHTNLLHVAAIKEEQKNWPTANARDWKDSITGTHPPSRPRMSEQTLGQAVSVVHGSWATPAARDTQGQRGAAANARKGNPLDTLPNQMTVYGQAAPASSSTGGSRRELSWATPAARDTQGKRGAAANARKGNPLDTLPNQMAQWATPQSRDAKGAEGRMIRLGNHSDLPSQIEVAPTGQWNRNNGKLNPRWVETLMGLPIGWTMPSCSRPVTIGRTSCDSSATESCRPPQSERSEFSLVS